MRQRGYAPELADAVIDSLEEWPKPRDGSGLLGLATALAGRYEVGEDAGLQALAAAVENELAQLKGKRTFTLWVQPPGGERPFSCSVREGMSIRDVRERGVDDSAKLLAEYLECACSGVAACSTCHVYVSERCAPTLPSHVARAFLASTRSPSDVTTLRRWFDAAGPPSEAEEDMLDLAYERKPNSRLGCQLHMSGELDGMLVRIPGAAHNLFDAAGLER